MTEEKEMPEEEMKPESEEKKEDEEEMSEIDVTEVVLDEEEIEELIEKLKELKTSKTSFEFDLDEDNELLIHHEDDPALEEGE